MFIYGYMGVAIFFKQADIRMIFIFILTIVSHIRILYYLIRISVFFIRIDNCFIRITYTILRMFTCFIRMISKYGIEGFQNDCFII